MSDRTEVVGLSEAVAARPTWIGALANRNFRLLWLGETFSLFGDQFYFVALPWLVFQMTQSSLAFGTVLMGAGIPRAVFLLVGGVVTDRFSARTVMIVSNLLRLGITVLLTVIVAGQVIHLWMLYVIAFSFGLVDAFFHPAYRAMIPMIVDEDHLQASNSVMLGASQLAQIGGRGVAGVLVESVGVALSFAFDAITFLFTSITLALMRPVATHKRENPESSQKRGSILAEIGQMLASVRHDPVLPTLVLVIAAINFLFSGPLIVGSATLGRLRFVEGSAAFGAMLSTFGIGMLIGTFAAGIFRTQRAGMISLLLVAAQGVLMVGIAYVQSLFIVCALWGLIGFGAGFGNVSAITITQKRVSKDMMGRFMSLIVLAEVGLVPLSNAIAGMVADWNVTALFVLSGILLSATALLAVLNPNMRLKVDTV